MPSDLISQRAREAFRDYLASRVHNPWTRSDGAEQIRELFDSVDVLDRELPTGDCRPLSANQRLIEKYYAGIDWTRARDIRKVVKVFAALLRTAQDGATSTGLVPLFDTRASDAKALRNLTRLLKHDGYEFKNGRLTVIDCVDLSKLARASDALDRNALREHLFRLELSVDDDPSQAIGSAKELLESVCKAIFEVYGADPDAYDTLPKLAKQTLKHLNLTLEDIPDSARGADSMKQISSGINQIVSGIAELRNLYGTGHGRIRQGGMKPRHARFVVSASVTLARFMLDTLEARQSAKNANGAAGAKGTPLPPAP